MAEKHDGFRNARLLEKRRMLLRLKRWLIQTRILTQGEGDSELLRTRVMNLPEKSFYVPTSVDERWRAGTNPELKKSPFFHIMKSIGRERLPVPREGLQDYLTNPGRRINYFVNVFDGEALEKIIEKLKTPEGEAAAVKDLMLEGDTPEERKIMREIENFKEVNLGKIPLGTNLHFRLYFKMRELRNRRN